MLYQNEDVFSINSGELCCKPIVFHITTCCKLRLDFHFMRPTQMGRYELISQWMVVDSLAPQTTKDEK